MATYASTGSVTLTAAEVKEALVRYINDTMGLNVELAATWASAGSGNTGGVISFDSRNS